MKIIKFKVDILYDINKNTKNFYDILSNKIKKFNDYGVAVVFSRKMMNNLYILNCNYKIHIQYQVNDYIGINDIFIYSYYPGSNDNIILSDKLILKEYRRQKLIEICLK